MFFVRFHEFFINIHYKRLQKQKYSRQHLQNTLLYCNDNTMRRWRPNVCPQCQGWGYSYIFLYGDVPLNRESFSQFRLQDRVSSSHSSWLHDRVHILHLLTPECRCGLCALHQLALNHLDGKISSFSGRFLTTSRAVHNFV